MKKRYTLWVLIALMVCSCGTNRRDREESVNLYREAEVLLHREDATLTDCRQAQQLLERSLMLDDKNYDAYFGKMLNELVMWLPDSAYRTASTAIEKLGRDNADHVMGYFYIMKACLAYERGDMVDFPQQLTEALSLYDGYLNTDPTNMDYLLNKAVILSGLKGRDEADSFILGLPLSAADKELLQQSLSEFDFADYGKSWRTKYERLLEQSKRASRSMSE